MSSWVRQFHRWVAVVFMLAVIANFIVIGQEPIALWVGVATLFPLGLLMLTGVYMFVLPYTAKRRSGH